MSIHFHTLQVASVRKETANCVSVVFSIPDELKDIFQFTQGQYLTLRTLINGEEIRRSYSICSSPLDNELRIAIKKVDRGVFSGFANQHLKKGDILDVMPPMGKFYTKLNPAQKKQYVGFAAGSGITPLISIIKTTLATEPESGFCLVYGNRNRMSIIFREELEALKNRYMSRFKLIHILSREKTDAPVNSGRIDAEKCNYLFRKLIDVTATDAFFLCGPETMIVDIKNSLEKQGVDQKKIHSELFHALQAHKTAELQTDQSEKQELKSSVTVKLDGTSFNFDLGYTAEPVLEAALKQGADLPYACKSGVCCTCRAKLLEGEVVMDHNYGLEADELQQGFILTCQSHPKTEKLVIDFDIR